MRRDINWKTKRDDGSVYYVRVTWFSGRFKLQFAEGKHGRWEYDRVPSREDLETFVDMLGFSPMEAILAGTKFGGQIMELGNELGMIKPGYLADMLLVDGDPIANIRVLQDKSRLLAIMKDGQFHKAPKMNEQRRRMTA